jgi:glycosyltransferase involved in cell wall biosynthesis
VSEEVSEPLPRAAAATPEGVPLALALGRLHPNKAFDVLIRAVAAIPGLHLWIAGDGPLRDALQSLAIELGAADRIRFLGWRDDVPALFAAADIFVCPSRHEPLGNVVIESWAQAVPVVAAAAQGPRQLIDNGTTGMLVPIDDPPALADALRHLLFTDGVAETLAAAGRRAFETRFTEAAVVARYQDFLAKVARPCVE